MWTSYLNHALCALSSAQRRVPRSDGPSADDAERLWMILGGAVALVVLFGVIMLLLRRFLFICRPNEILVFSGRSHVLPDGTTSGYKILHGGRGFRMPFLETVSRMDMRLFP